MEQNNSMFNDLLLSQIIEKLDTCNKRLEDLTRAYNTVARRIQTSERQMRNTSERLNSLDYLYHDMREMLSRIIYKKRRFFNYTIFIEKGRKQ